MVEERHLRRVATRLGIDADEETVAACLERARDAAARFEAIETARPTDRPATDTADGADEHNAVRHRFSLPETEGQLADLSAAVKDNTAVAGVPMHCGSAALAFRPDSHATVVARLRAAGADLRATTNMDEFAYFTTGETCAFGRVENPRLDGRVPGGSSAGSGAAVAAGLVDVALGTDTVGSVRIPASYCGVVGLKPTHGALSRVGVADLAPSLDAVGPLADDVETAARVFDAVAGPDRRDPATRGHEPAAAAGLGASIEGRRIGVIEESPADDDVQAALDRALDALAAAGARPDPVSLPAYREATTAALAAVGAEFSALALTEGRLPGTAASDAWRSALSEALRSPDLGSGVRDQLLIAGALATSGDDRYAGAQQCRATLARAIDDRLERYDALLAPTTPTTAPEFGAVRSHEAFRRTVANTAPFSLTGHPALSVPAGRSGDAPVGIQFVAARDDERTLVALGAALEAD